jgi:hypothetical protein
MEGLRRDIYMGLARQSLLALALLSGCNASTSLGTAGPLFTSVTLDASPWQPDTAFAVLNGANGGIVTISLLRFPFPGTPAVEPLAITLAAFTGTGTYALTDALGDNQAYFPVRDTLGQTPLIFSTRSSHPGHIVITAYDPTDSTIAGTFSFTVFGQTDTTRLHTFTGQFRLRDAY